MTLPAVGQGHVVNSNYFGGDSDRLPEIVLRDPRLQKFNLGIHVGLDIGAAVPWGSNGSVLSGGDKINATPKLTPALGFSGEWRFNWRWSAVVEATYKTVALDASILTMGSGQKFQDEGLDVIFYGKAKTSMSFTMFEFPLYVKYRIGRNNRVYLGGYYAHIVNGKFDATAYNGRLENPEQPDDIQIVHPSDPLSQDFSQNLRHHDAGWLVGYERRLLDRLTLAGRFSMGLLDIFKPGENYLEYKMLNMRGTVMLSYKFL